MKSVYKREFVKELKTLLEFGLKFETERMSSIFREKKRGEL